MNPENKRPLAPRLGDKFLAMAAAISGLAEVPAMSSKRPTVRVRAKGAPASSKPRHGKSGNKLRKLADKGGIGLRKHW